MVPAIAIIGGGPCGLTLARLLECKGFDYIVYERDESEHFNPGGGSLDIHEEDGQRALREAGLFGDFQKHARWEDDVFQVYDMLGKKWAQLGGETTPGQNSGGRPEIDRLALRKILLNSIPKHKICWNSSLKRVTSGEDGAPVLEFTDGRIATGFSLIVGADGAWSKVRPLITQAQPKYTNKFYLESKISTGSPIYESIAQKMGRGTSTYLGGPKQAIVQRQGDGSYRFYLSMQVPEDFGSSDVDIAEMDAMRKLLLSPEYFADTPEEVQEMIKHAEPFRRWPLYTLPVEALNWDSVPGVALVGDAAHVTIPNGDGVNCAMADALTLVNKLSTYGLEGRDQAVQEYEKDMFVRSRASMEQGFRLWELMSHPDGPPAFLKAFEDGFGS